MAYDRGKDKELLRLKYENAHRDDVLEVSIHQYNGGAPKVQISRKQKVNGEMKYVKAGRLYADEFQFIDAQSGKIKAVLHNAATAPPEPPPQDDGEIPF